MDRGQFPAYANRGRLVRLLCKNGDCSKGGLSWAEMTTDHPGWHLLRNSQAGDFAAVCLECGKTAMDPHNWSP
jgi:hypothetical protein